MGKVRILILGGTTEARKLAERLATRTDLDIVLSLAGRTAEPLPLPVPVRSGGFGGPEGLAQFLRLEDIGLMIDATHPFAERISANATEAARLADVPAFSLRRPGWEPGDGDRWISVSSIAAAVEALGPSPRRVFLTIGRQEAYHFNAAPQHRYFVRSIDPVEPPLRVPQATYILSAGPFTLEGESRLLQAERIDVIVSKNSGGTAAYAKIEAARLLGIDIVMVERGTRAGLPAVASIEAALDEIDHLFSPAMKRGV
ncbi:MULTISPECIES: cobalt-precorrin-6A reductase [unclassified Sinorhizobium]|uniref:cobalt-precorrin-6A reductase n=1 Tax=unclassified Sinorhizobium TaxID=2613772 RepID=UPI0035250765